MPESSADAVFDSLEESTIVTASSLTDVAVSAGSDLPAAALLEHTGRGPAVVGQQGVAVPPAFAETVAQAAKAAEEARKVCALVSVSVSAEPMALARLQCALRAKQAAVMAGGIGISAAAPSADAGDAAASTVPHA